MTHMAFASVRTASLEGSGGLRGGETQTGSLVIQTPRGISSLVRTGCFGEQRDPVCSRLRYSAASA
jgi:hypothetical protein